MGSTKSAAVSGTTATAMVEEVNPALKVVVSACSEDRRLPASSTVKEIVRDTPGNGSAIVLLENGVVLAPNDGFEEDANGNDFLQTEVQPRYGRAYTSSWCLAAARDIYPSAKLTALPSQGDNSFSVCMDGNHILQLRLPLANVRFGQLAARLYPKWVPLVEKIEPSPFPLQLWKSPRFPGIPLSSYKGHYDYTGNDPGLGDRICVIATIIGRATMLPSEASEAVDAVLCKLRCDLETITDPEYKSHADAVLGKLHLLRNLPLALAHGDLLAHNILVDPENGRVQGVIDWEMAKISFFGADLWSLDRLLMIEQPNGIKWYDTKHRQEEMAWENMWKAVPPAIRTCKDDMTIRAGMEVAKQAALLQRFALPGRGDNWRSRRRVEYIIQDGFLSRFLRMI